MRISGSVWVSGRVADLEVLGFQNIHAASAGLWEKFEAFREREAGWVMASLPGG